MTLSLAGFRLTLSPEVEPSRQKVSGKSIHVHVLSGAVSGSPFVGNVFPPLPPEPPPSPDVAGLPVVALSLPLHAASAVVTKRSPKKEARL